MWPHLAEVGLVFHSTFAVHMQNGGGDGCCQIKAKPQLVHDGLSERKRMQQERGIATHTNPSAPTPGAVRYQGFLRGAREHPDAPGPRQG